MAGLSVLLLEGGKDNYKVVNKATMLVNKNIMIIVQPNNDNTTASPAPPNTNPSQYYVGGHRNFKAPVAPNADFLDFCFLCKRKVLPGKDIYMYKGDRAFCSIECRCKHILMDEEENNLKPMMRMREKPGTSSLLSIAKDSTTRTRVNSSPPDTTSYRSPTSSYSYGKPRHHLHLC